jgi:hypothetical protein
MLLVKFLFGYNVGSNVEIFVIMINDIGHLYYKDPVKVDQ